MERMNGTVLYKNVVRNHINSHVPLPLWRQLLAGILLFLLIQQWLLPLFQHAEITQMYQAEPFYIAVLFFLLLSFLRLPLNAIFIFYAFISLLIVAYYFKEGNVFHLFQNDFFAVKARNWHQVSDELRTFVFLYGLSLVCYAVSAWMLERKRIGWFIIVTLIYLLFMEIVWEANMDMVMIRTFIYGMLLILVCRLDIRLRFSTRGRKIAWILPLAMVGSSALLSMFAANYFSSTLPSISYMNSLPSTVQHALQQIGTHESFSLSKKKSGYGAGDHRLGGAIQMDNSIAFVAETSVPTYWKGESKTIYDGSGWHVDGQINMQIDVQIDEQIIKPINGQFEFEKSLSSAHLLPFLDQNDNFSLFLTDEHPIWYQRVYNIDDQLENVLFRGGPLLSIKVVDQTGQTQPERYVMYDHVLDRYEWRGKKQVSNYEMSLPPIHLYDVNEVWKYIQTVRAHLDVNIGRVTEADFTEAIDEDLDGTYGYDEWFEVYTQLPVTLPERVVQLGAQIVGDEHRAFEKALRIERYLRSNYEYDTDTSYPVGDFVDHFLFESGRGYCDHFSTAMVVLLRSQGIPSRWVKGFAPGDIERVETNAEGEVIYTVTVRNSHAHSWAEAYIPELGWIPFEPTPSSSHLDTWEVLAEGSFAFDFDQGENKRTQTGFSPLLDLYRSYQLPVFVLIIALFALLFITSLFILTFEQAKKIRCAFIILALRWKKHPPSERVLCILWEQLYHLYGTKNDHETFREYVQRTAPHLPQNLQHVWEQFLQWTEQHRYGASGKETAPLDSPYSQAESGMISHVSLKWQSHWQHLWSYRKP